MTVLCESCAAEVSLEDEPREAVRRFLVVYRTRFDADEFHWLEYLAESHGLAFDALGMVVDAPQTKKD